MKVICINNGPLENNAGEIWTAPELAEVTTYTIIRCVAGYHLKEVECKLAGGFDKRRFIPISTIDEMELLEHRQTQYA